MLKFKKVILSAAILFHLLTMVILANGASWLGRHTQSWAAPYGNAIGINTTWNFFSPDPAHTMFIRFKVEFEDDYGNELKEPIEGFIPEEKESVVMDSSKRRFLYAMRFLILDHRRLETIMGPYLCKKYPEASRIHVEHILQGIPVLDRAALTDETQTAPMQLLTHTANCKEVRENLNSTEVNTDENL